MFPKPLLRQNKKSKTPIWWNSKPPLGDLKIQNHYLVIQKIKTPIWHISKSKPLNRHFQTPKKYKFGQNPSGGLKISKTPILSQYFSDVCAFLFALSSLFAYIVSVHEWYTSFVWLVSYFCVIGKYHSVLRNHAKKDHKRLFRAAVSQRSNADFLGWIPLCRKLYTQPQATLLQYPMNFLDLVDWCKSFMP